MKKVIGILFLMFIVTRSISQILPPEPPPPPPPPLPMPITDTTTEEKVIIESDEIFDFVEVEPEFPGGHSALMKYLSTNIIYPPISKVTGVEGNVFIQFIVDKTGQVKDCRVVRGVNSELDHEALRVVRNMPNWKPGTLRGKPVNVRYTIPINFKLV